MKPSYPFWAVVGVDDLRLALLLYAAWAAEHPRIEVRPAPVLGDTETLADMVIERYDEALSGDIRMNCDTCVHRIALPGFEARVGCAATASPPIRRPSL